VGKKIAFVTNFCPHYRVRTFEMLGHAFDVDFLFFSRGNEWYWSRGLSVRTGDFNYEYLSGFRIGRTRITPVLPSRLLSQPYDLYIKCINGRFALPSTYLAARRRGKPFILWTGLWSAPEGLAHRLARPLTLGLYRRSDAIVTYGEHVRTHLFSQGVSRDKIFVAPHAIDNELYGRVVTDREKAGVRHQLGLGPQDRVVLYVGRLEPSKGVDYLLEAFDDLRIPGATLVIVGDGAERERLRQAAASLSPRVSVRFAGQLSPETLIPFYAMAETVVLPSVTTAAGKEPWGLVVNEAFNQGTPVVVTATVGAAAGGLVQDGRNGFIVPERDGRTIAERLRRLLTYPDLRTRLGEEARKTIRDWDNERMVGGFRQAIEYVTDPSAIDTRQRERIVLPHRVG
jgi:glycosyltransferase involved in cell wall biosynthesis